MADGRRWFVPSEEIEGTTSISLGSAKYAEFEVGRPNASPRIAGLESPQISGGAPELESRAGL
ncbi:MAG: hypothetical protein EXQ70_11745 [Solirubrobacterales bacterium]|nr:hypothetical protein [Solirubrobacterales bacterium]